jgi:hypothetical protein
VGSGVPSDQIFTGRRKMMRGGRIQADRSAQFGIPKVWIVDLGGPGAPDHTHETVFALHGSFVAKVEEGKGLTQRARRSERRGRTERQEGFIAHNTRDGAEVLTAFGMEGRWWSVGCSTWPGWQRRTARNGCATGATFCRKSGRASGQVEVDGRKKESIFGQVRTQVLASETSLLAQPWVCFQQ